MKSYDRNVTIQMKALCLYLHMMLTKLLLVKLAVKGSSTFLQMAVGQGLWKLPLFLFILFFFLSNSDLFEP